MAFPQPIHGRLNNLTFLPCLPQQRAQLGLDLLRDDVPATAGPLWHYLKQQIPNPRLIL